MRLSRTVQLVLAWSALLACGQPAAVPVAVSSGRGPRVSVRSFSEAGPVRQVVAVARYLFTAGDAGLDRWELASGRHVRFTGERGLPGQRVSALAGEPGRSRLWVVTEDRVARHEVATGGFVALPPPPGHLGTGPFSAAVAAADGRGGLWLGLPTGLFHISFTGVWSSAIAGPIAALLVSGDVLWIGTGRGLYRRGPERRAVRLDAGRGCDLFQVEQLAGPVAGRVLAIGRERGGAGRLLLLQGTRCAAYALPAALSRPLAAATPGGFALLGDRELFALAPAAAPAPARQRELPLVPAGPGAEPGPVLRPMQLPVPQAPIALAAAGGALFVATRHLGVARMPPRPGERLYWFHRGELALGAQSLSVACHRRDDCYIATGASKLWRYTGAGVAIGRDGAERVLAVVRDRDGSILAIHQAGHEARLALTRIAPGGQWQLAPAASIETPGPAELSFARPSPAGVLWLGLRYATEAGDMRPWGVALVDAALGTVAYHHASASGRERQRGVLPVPIDVVDVGFIGESQVWLASSEGAAQLEGDTVTVYDETRGLRSELLRGIAASAGGIVFVASRSGIGSFDGESWQYPRQLGWSSNDVEIGADGRLWIATDRGLAVYDGSRVRRLDARRGLVEDSIVHVALDHYGRVWALGKRSLSLVEP